MKETKTKGKKITRERTEQANTEAKEGVEGKKKKQKKNEKNRKQLLTESKFFGKI